MICFNGSNLTYGERQSDDMFTVGLIGYFKRRAERKEAKRQAELKEKRRKQLEEMRTLYADLQSKKAEYERLSALHAKATRQLEAAVKGKPNR